MSAAPVRDGAARRTIGDILLAHGFVSEEALTEACAEQARTAQPLGQILVQRGAITRLELASALAEQWTDPSASIKLLPLPATGGPVVMQPHDDAQYAARLQDAVADLARRVQANQPLEGVDERITELSHRIEATLARTQRIEVTAATLAEGLEGVTTSVEEAFAGLQTGTADLDQRLERLDRTVADLAARPLEAPLPDPVLSARLDDLRAAVDALAARPAADEAARGRVEELETRLETLAGSASLDELRDTLRDLEGRPTRDPELEARLDRVEALAEDRVSRADFEARAVVLSDLQATLTELEARPTGSPDLDQRLERLETQLEERLATFAGAETVDALAERVEEAAAARDGLVAAIAALDSRLGAIAGRDPHVDDIVTRLDAMEAGLETGAAAVAALSNAAATAQARPADDGRLEALSLAVAAVREELAALATPTERLAERVEELAARVGQLAADPVDQAPLAERLESVEVRLAADLDTIDVLARAIDRIRADLEGTAAPSLDTAPADGAVTGLEDRLAVLEALAARVDELAETMDERIAALGAPRSQVTGEPSDANDELERVRMAIERVGLHLGEHDRALAELMRSRGVSQRLEELAARVEELAAAGSRGSAADTGAPSNDVSGDVRALMRRVEEAETASQSDRERLMSRLERMASSIDWRLHRLETDEPE